MGGKGWEGVGVVDKLGRGKLVGTAVVAVVVAADIPFLLLLLLALVAAAAIVVVAVAAVIDDIVERTLPLRSPCSPTYQQRPRLIPPERAPASSLSFEHEVQSKIEPLHCTR